MRIRPAPHPPLRGTFSRREKDVEAEKLARLVTLTNDQHPDLTLILGDSVIQDVIGGHFMPPETCAHILGGLRARYGVFGVLGNHDGWLSADRVKAAFDSNGIPTLVNETRTLAIAGGSVTLAGLADLMTRMVVRFICR
ncbi:MAG TPA: hypothetical protein VJ032_04930 [Thermoanaerobaculia bacterium]|nr:hypothetical protein [Thermoanaerobaculia bacterium]